MIPYVKKILDLVYPIGSIYISVNSTSPSTLFGGEWTQLKDRFLLGAGSTYIAGEKGGTTTHNHGYRIGYHPNYGALIGDDDTAITAYDYGSSSWKSASQERKEQKNE